jgi:sugar lactone lactonase YvrE
MKTFTRLFVPLLALASILLATETTIWTQDEASDFEKGSLKRLSLSSDGRVTLAPRFQEIFDSDSVYLWALAEDSRGNIYAGGGGPGGPGACVYAIDPAGHGKTLAQFEDLEVHALAVDSKDRLYAATSPDGKVYRISPDGKPEVFYDPQAKYIWAMAFNSRGDLFIATGDRGEIHRVSPDGKGSVFYKTAETHARSLAIDSHDNLIVGTEPGGLILRVAPDGAGFVLYQAPKREVTAVAVARDGSIYAAASGNKQPSAPHPPTPAPTPQVVPRTAAPTAPVAPNAPAQVRVAPTVTPTPVPTAIPPVLGGSEVYRILPDGFPREVWSHPQDIAYTIAFDSEGRPLVGTGNKGIIYRLDSDLVSTTLFNASPTQVTAIYNGRGGKLYTATGNVGKVYQIGPGLESEGTLESDVFDAELFSYWGRLSFRGQPNGGQIAIETRSGNLDRPETDWSPWSAAITSTDGGRISSPPARFLQWRAKLTASSSGVSPMLESVDAAYLSRNVAPVVREIEITPANYRFPPPITLTSTLPPVLTLPPLGKTTPTSSSSLSASSSVTLNYAKGHIGARWADDDGNGDSLIFTIQIRGEKETEWKPLQDKLKYHHLSWDSTAFPDGEYRIRVIASDEPSNPPDQALTGELTSDPFLIDNTPPVISGLAAAPASGKLRVAWKAADALSIIDKAEISLNGADWQRVDPTTKLSDSREEDYVVFLPLPPGAEQTVAVRVTDDYDNEAVSKVVVKTGK